MKALSIQQPWGQYIAAGIQDVENRTWPVRTFPMRALIHVGKKKQVTSMEEEPFAFRLIVENAEMLDIVPMIEDMPTGGVIGVVDIVGCTENGIGNPSPWAQWAEEGAEITVFNLKLANARLFKEPILDVKGKQGFFEIPGISEDNLPECIEIPCIRREGTELFIPCGQGVLAEIEGMDAPLTWSYNLFENNLHLFIREDGDELEELETTHITFFHGDRKIRVQVIEREVLPMEYEGETVTFVGARDEMLEWWKVFYTVLPLDMDADEFASVETADSPDAPMTLDFALDKLDPVSRIIIDVLQDSGLSFDFEKSPDGNGAVISSQLVDSTGSTQFIEFHVNLEINCFFINMTRDSLIPKRSMKKALEAANLQNSERASGYVFIDPESGMVYYRDSLYVCDGKLSPKAVEIMLSNGRYELENAEEDLLK